MKAIVNGFTNRLKTVAGFEFVVEPVPMRNSNNAVVYYLMFASNNSTGHKIAKQVMKGYRK